MQISIGDGAGGWVAYGILFVLALVYVSFVLMLVAKLIEAAVRIFGGLGFDRSKHVVDSGLLGAFGMLGCCGSRKKHRNTRHRYRATEVPRDAVSEVSSYLPPAAGFLKGSTPSHHSQPASVLRPEHALRPYREDSDDESGYIMGAWQPFPRPGYTAVEGASPTQAHPNASATSGFSRVGGGRATFDTPYAIAATGSTVTFPSARTASGGGPFPPSLLDNDAPTASVANIARQPQQADAELPLGAMLPHMRMISQTAMVEDYNPNPTSHPVPPSAYRIRRASSSAVVDDDDADVSQPKKKHWYNVRKKRRHSDGALLTRDEELAVTAPTPGKSFVVIRDKKPQRPQSTSLGQHQPSDAEASGSEVTDGETTPKERRGSFMVLRDNKNSGGKGSS